MTKALQAARGPLFDVTLDLEDGAAAGREREQLDVVLALLLSDRNAFDRVGVRIHGLHTPWWRQELATLTCEAGAVLMAAAAAGWAPVKHAGRLHDAGSYRHHWQVLQRARTTGQSLPGDVLAHFSSE